MPRVEPIRPDPAPADAPRLLFHRGQQYPKAVAWLGFRSFWGHVWHLAASVIATEAIDARDWMQTGTAGSMTRRVARLLVPGRSESDERPLTEQLEGDLWLDFIADTGDDRELSRAVAELVFRDYRVPDEGGEILAPRGHVLLFGGDTAYPVATDLEIHNRVCVPFNEVLRERDDGQPRALLGIPGNHDWYSGLDGFARMFRARRGTVDEVENEARIDQSGQLGHFLDWIEAFAVGRFVHKRRTLPLLGYTPVQEASYFALHLAPNLDLWAVDRQLRAVDFSQRGFFHEERERSPNHGLVLMLADPVRAMLEPNPAGVDMLEAIDVTLERDRPLVLSGDTHHYCREQVGGATHVVAGGGGAFLHPARIERRSVTAPAAEFPGPAASRALAWSVPWQLALGRAGFIVHTGLALLLTPIALLLADGDSITLACALVALAAAFIAGSIGGWRKGRGRGIIATLSIGYGALVGALPVLAQMALPHLGVVTGSLASIVTTVVGSVLVGALGFGGFLTLLTVLGVEQHQAFSTLAHPGYKHFVRLRVRRDGSSVDAWVFGAVDPLARDAKPVLVDRFSWKNPAARSDT